MLPKTKTERHSDICKEINALYARKNHDYGDSFDRAFDMDKESSILWMLHTQFGFGPKRLKLAWKLFYAETLKLREYYLMDQEDDGWLARQKLKDIGCDIEEWYREEGGKTDA